MATPFTIVLFCIAVAVPVLAGSRDWQRLSMIPRAAAQASRLAPRMSDSVVVNIINTMDHPWDISYLNGEARVPLGHVDGGATTAVALPKVVGDSVTLVAISSEMGILSRTFPTHSATALVWQF